MPDKQINKILIIRLSSLGDILLSTPVIRAIKQKFAKSQIDFVVKKEFKDSLLYNPNISNLIIYEKENANQLKNEVKIADYDLIIDLQNNFRSNDLTNSTKTQIKRFKKPTLRKLLLVWFKINFLKNIKTISERYAETAGVEINNNGLELFYPQNINTEFEDGKNYIGFCPGSKHFTKRWPSEYFIELGNKLAKQGFIIVLFGGKDDEELCDTISAKIEGSINLQNEDLLLQTAAEMKHCNLIISNDSGLMHTASAVGLPLISIFGSTVKEFGFMPSGPQNLILENKLLSCRPCSHIGRSSCPKKHFKCMKEITPELVQSQIHKIQAGI